MELNKSLMELNSPLPIQLFLNTLEVGVEVWVSRTLLATYKEIFRSAGWACSDDSEVNKLIELIAEEGLIEADIDHKGRVRKIKRNK